MENAWKSKNLKWSTIQMWKESRYCDKLVIYFAKENNCELFFFGLYSFHLC
jgi:hypothetical protein